VKRFAAIAALALGFSLAGHAFAQRVHTEGGPPVPDSEKADGQALYEQHCSECHDFPTGRIPARSFISIILSPETIIRTLSKGVMKPMAKGLEPQQIHDIAVFLVGREPGGDPQPDINANKCADDGGPIDFAVPAWNGWGRDIENSRYNPDPGLSAGDLSRLKVKWAFAYPGIAYGQPTMVAGRVFIETRDGEVFSLDAKTGCTHWVYELDAPVRTAITVGALPDGSPSAFAAFFADEKGKAYAVDAVTGKLLWSTQVEDHPLARITGSPKLFRGRLYVPVSSMEEVAGGTPRYQCCTFRGSVVALNIATGKKVWKTYIIPQKPKKTRVNPNGTQMFGPAGAAVWDSPAIDPKRGVLYVGTGDSYTETPTDATDAIVALDLATGARKWVTQVRSNDDWLLGCPETKDGNCPKESGPDFDFGASPILHTLPSGKQVILAGAKSSIVYAFDPDQKGKILWQRKLGAGSNSGGIVWGPAVDGNNIYVSIGDAWVDPPAVPGGVFALDAATGSIVWQTPGPPPVCSWGTEHCSKAQPSGVTAMPGIVFAGSWDGHLRAYSVKDGKIVWDFDTAKTFDGVNGVKAKGGAIDMGGQTIAGGMLAVNSGVTPIQKPGNALLMLTVDGK
jgi:polyvinyl alcohol dehydrogenase (cytochrome)